MTNLKAQNNALTDTLNGVDLAIFVDPVAQVLLTHRCNASACKWDDNTLALVTGERIRNGYVQSSSSKKDIDTSEQQFVRWYAFSYKLYLSTIG